MSASKVTHSAASAAASGATIVVLPEPEAPVTTNTGALTAPSERLPHSGHRACSPAGSMARGSAQRWQ
jgi:hypothetical protein